MGYNIELSINMLNVTKFSEIEKTIYDVAETYNCNNIYSLNEEDGTLKIPRYHCVYVVTFSEDSFDNLIKFVKFIKKCKISCYIECIYNDNIYKLLYASSYYLNNSNRELSKKYKKFIENKIFTPNEYKLLTVLI
jgi:hypothetical protein